MTRISVLVLLSAAIHAQTFSSGSNGSDGALNLITPGVIVFDPKSTATFGRVLDADGDGIYHFTTINVAAGVTVKFRANVVSGPIYWLAQGAVTIAGTLDLNGEPGYNDIASIADRVPSIAGSGGFAGGVGRWSDSSPSQPGHGPGGGSITIQSCVSCCHARYGGGGLTVNTYLVPLLGGSGGAGGNRGGGAGGGAILISSSLSVAISGLIAASGGVAPTGGGRTGGGGAGGSIRVVAPAIGGNGTLSISGGDAGECSGRGSTGAIRLEAFTFSGGLSGTRATPFNLFLPTGGQSSVRVTMVSGLPVPANSTGSFSIPDVSINASVAVPFAIEARNVPVGTIIKLQIFSETGVDQTIDATPLAGTLAVSTATANALLPSGFSRGTVRAIWTQ